MLPEMSGYVKTFKVKDGDEDKKNQIDAFHTNVKSSKENLKIF